MDKSRCSWPGTDPLMIKYHDEEWGMPCHDDQKLFEYIVLDTFQAGLSWAIVLYKRENFRQAFDNFDPVKISSYSLKAIRTLENNPSIIRNKLKIAATVTNAQAFLVVQKEFGTFDKYIWGFVGGKPIVNHHQKDSDSDGAPAQELSERSNDIGATSPESDAMSKDMKSHGFKFVGSTVCYAFMQGAGLVNDHIVSCNRYRNLT